MADERISPEVDRVAELYRDKTIFLTGGTGFVGKVLIEKLLRSCTDLKVIYVLMRNKKGKEPVERLRDIFRGPLFDKLKKEQGPDIINKVKPMYGDVTCLDLGLSNKDRQTIINEAEIVFHCAATVRFDEPLKSAVILNVRGTKLMLTLAKEMKKLLAFAYLSTSYCHLNEKLLQEKPYDPPADAHNVIKTVEWLNEEIIDSITDKILGDIPNTYAFTKSLAESLIVAEMNNLPVLILRPSIILPIWKEPLPGWTDNLNGPTGLLIGAGKGVIRTMYCNGDGYGDLLPVDIAVNGILTSSFDFIKNNKKRRIFNMTSSSEYKLSWTEIIELGRNIIETKMPLNGVVWYPGGSMKRSRIIHLICFILFHAIPAIIIDGLLTILGYKPVLIRVQKRIYKGFEVFEYYANNQWDFCNDNCMDARMQLNSTERNIYKIDGQGFNYKEYFTDCIHAARLYLLKEPDDTLPAARRHMKVMWYVDKITKLLLTLGIMYYLYVRVFMPIFA